MGQLNDCRDLMPTGCFQRQKWLLSNERYDRSPSGDHRIRMPNRNAGNPERNATLEVERIAGQVRHNCDVSDAKNAGLYSICGLALRLRDLFKWEMGLPPWEEKDSPEILDWIGGREQRWEKLADHPFSSITIQNRDFEPFDTTTINQ